MKQEARRGNERGRTQDTGYDPEPAVIHAPEGGETDTPPFAYFWGRGEGKMLERGKETRSWLVLDGSRLRGEFVKLYWWKN